MVGGKARGKRTRYKLGLIHAPVVRAHATVRQVARAVEEAHLGMGDGRLGRACHERGRAREDHPHALLDSCVNHGREVV